METRKSMDLKHEKQFGLFKIDEENQESFNESMEVSNIQENTKDNLKDETENEKHEQEVNLDTREIRLGSTHLKTVRGMSTTSFQKEQEPEQSFDSESDDSIDDDRENNIEFIESMNDFQNAKANVSFFDGRPKDEEDILKLECPLYRCDRSTIVVKKFRKSAISSIDGSHRKTLDNFSTTKKTRSPALNINKQKTRRNAGVDINITNTLQIRTFTSLFMTILQIINCIIRYTIVQFPFCIKTLGLIYGPIIISIIGSMSIFSVYMLIKVKEFTDESSYSAFAFKWWGLKGKIFILVLNCLSSFGSCLSYIIIFLKVIPKLVNIGIGDFFIADEKLLSIVLGLWLLVYCYQNDISGIKAAAFWGILGIIFYLILNIVLLLYSSYIEDIPEDTAMNFVSLDWSNSDVYSCIACVILSFSFHTYAFPIYECLDTPDQKKMIVTSSIGIFISMLIYLLVGTIGYVLYGSHITDSILDSLGMTSLGVLISISFVVNVVMSFPLTFNALKHYFMFLIEIIVTLCVQSCCKKGKKKEQEMTDNNAIPQADRTLTSSAKHIKEEIHHNDKDHDAEDNHDKHDKHNAHNGHMEMVHIPHSVEYILIFCIFCLIFFTSVNFPSMKTIFSFLGATTANFFSFILPAMYYIKFSRHKICHWKNILPFTFIIVGVVGMVVCVTSNIIYVVHGVSH